MGGDGQQVEQTRANKTNAPLDFAGLSDPIRGGQGSHQGREGSRKRK